MKKHNHNFVEDYDGLVGFGMNRETDEFTLTYYLQKFADDEFISVLRKRMSDSDLEELFNYLTLLMKKYLKEEEYHVFFLKEKD